MVESKELQAKEKKEVTTPGEQTRPGVLFTPDVDIFEPEKSITLMADLPGVTADGLNIDLRDDMLTITGAVKPARGADESDIVIEYDIGKYFRQFTMSEVIDQEKIDAQLKDGVLRLTLPKVAKAQPRKISVRAA